MSGASSQESSVRRKPFLEIPTLSTRHHEKREKERRKSRGRDLSASSSDDEKKKSGPGFPTGSSCLAYSLGYEHNSQTLIVNVLQCRLGLATLVIYYNFGRSTNFIATFL